MRIGAVALVLALAACTAAPAPAPISAPVAAPRVENAAPAVAPASPIECAERVATTAVANVVDAKWSPDSSSLALVRTVEIPNRWTITGIEEQRILSILDVATGRLTDLNVATMPEWSASGTYLSYWRDENRSKEDEFLRIVKGATTVGLVASTQPGARWVGDELLHWYDNEIRAWKDGQVRLVARVPGPTPIYPAEDTAFSADGERFTLTRYTLSGATKRFVGITRTGELAPIDDADVAYTEWSPRGATLLLRSAERVTVRAGDGSERSAQLEGGARVHGWTADGRVILGTISPTIPGGDAADRFRALGDDAPVTVPNVMGARAFSPDGAMFAGVTRTGLASTELAVYRCGAPAAARADTAARARAAQFAADGPRLARPVAGAITQYLQGRHTGVDVAAPLGSIIYADDDGVVSATDRHQIGGRRVCVTHGDGAESCAYHTALPLVRTGERVARGQPIGLVGMTGVTTGPHVHWEITLGGRPVDPLAR